MTVASWSLGRLHKPLLPSSSAVVRGSRVAPIAPKNYPKFAASPCSIINNCSKIIWSSLICSLSSVSKSIVVYHRGISNSSFTLIISGVPKIGFVPLLSQKKRLDWKLSSKGKWPGVEKTWCRRYELEGFCGRSFIWRCCWSSQRWVDYYSTSRCIMISLWCLICHWTHIISIISVLLFLRCWWRCHIFVFSLIANIWYCFLWRRGSNGIW